MNESIDKKLIFDGFWLKILACLFMLIDHIGSFLNFYYFPISDPIIIIFKTIGRLSLPLFCFLVAQGVKNSKDKNKYLLRLAIMATLITFILLINYFCKFFPITFNNIFIDLFLGCLTLILFTNKNIKIKVLAVFPLLFAILCFIVKYIETSLNITILWLPNFLRSEYDFYSLLLIFGFYLCYFFTNKFLLYHQNKTGIEKEVLQETTFSQKIYNVFSFCVLMVLTIVFAIISSTTYPFYNIPNKTVAILSGVFILLYNGKRGYNSKWFQHGMYLFYPFHIGLLFLIFYLLTI